MSRGEKVWFRWPNGQMQRVYIYEDFTIKGDICHRASSGHRSFVLKDSEYGKNWARTKKELER